MKRADFPWLRGRSFLSVAMAGAVALAASASVNGAPRTQITPYLEIQQVLSADFNDGDVLTYTGIGGGVNGTVETRRVSATIGYNYQHRIAWNDGRDNDGVHSGIAAVGVQLVPNLLRFDAGAMATQTNADPRLPTTEFGGFEENVARVYSAYAGPTLSTQIGGIDVGASYRLGYVHIDDDSLSGGDLPPGLPPIQRYSSSTVHNATASIGMGPGRLPFGWTVGGGYVREDMDRLDSTYEAYYVRGDIVVPLSPTLAVTAGAGHETIESSQQDILRVGGVPVTDANGSVVADPSKPRLLTYDESGLIWDAGVIWRPSPRTELQGRVGRRYGSMTYTASLQHQLNQSYSFNASVYDNVSSFGRLLVADLSGMPRSFKLPRPGLGQSPGGVGECVFGNDPGTGVCFDDALRSIDNFNFRNRGASLMLSGGRGPWSYGVGAGYNTRRYYAPPGPDFVLHGVTDQSFSLSANAGRRLSRTSGFDLAAYAAWYDSGIVDADGSFSTGATGTYYRTIFHDRISATASAGVFTSQAGDFDRTVGSAMVGLRYSF